MASFVVLALSVGPHVVAAEEEEALTPQQQKMQSDFEALIKKKQAKVKRVPEGISNKPVVMYLRGKAGTPFASKESILREALPPQEKIAEAKETIRSTIEENIKNYKGERLEPINVPTCLASRTDKQVVKGMKYGNGAVSDTLIMNAADMPDDIGAAVGRDVVVLPYKRESIDGVSLSVGSMLHEIECIPYRLRLVQGAVYRHWGAAALRDYQKNHHGAGVLHESFKRVVEIQGW